MKQGLWSLAVLTSEFDLPVFNHICITVVYVGAVRQLDSQDVAGLALASKFLPKSTLNR